MTFTAFNLLAQLQAANIHAAGLNVRQSEVVSDEIRQRVSAALTASPQRTRAIAKQAGISEPHCFKALHWLNARGRAHLERTPQGMLFWKREQSV